MRTVDSNGVRLQVFDEGTGTPVLLLHGFPDSHALWRNQVPALLDAGYRVIAPDLRGFGGSDRPEGVASYALANIIGDLMSIYGACGIERAHVVGHDWGAGLTWSFASFVPDAVDKVVAISVGHPMSFRDPPIEQLERSWYFLLFQFDEAEELLSRNDWKLLRAWLREGGEGGDAYIEQLSRPGALTAALNWYRANVHPRTRAADPPMDFPPIKSPVMGMWSPGDHFLTEHGMKASEAFVAGPWRYERVEDASHWIPLDQPQRLNELLLGFLGDP